MEQAQCWVWKQADIFKSSMNSSASSTTTWEEKAFAEDAAGLGPHGGCVWPPRSYSCSFCMREFRSAQALGGHMNVHRRDRARLKQCLNPTNKILASPPPNNYSLRVPPIQKENILSDHSKPRDIIDQDCSSTCLIGGDSNVETDLSVGLSFSVSRNRSCKRPRISSSFPFFLHSEEAEVTRGLMGSSMEDLDLELRLGDPPKRYVESLRELRSPQ